MSDFRPASISCVVSAKTREQKLEGSCSAIIINRKQNLILSHASLLAPLLQEELKIVKSLKKSGFITDKKVLSNFQCKVYFSSNHHCSKNLYIHETSSNHGDQNVNCYYKQVPASLLCIFRCQSLKKVLLKLISSSEYEFPDIGKSDSEASSNDVKVNPEITYDLLSCFVLLKAIPPNDVVRDPHLKLANQIKLGDKVEIWSTPFGNLNPEVFLNSVSSGIISNLAGDENVLLLTDARCIPGSEGAGLFACSGEKRFLTGIIIAPLCWKNNEWVGLALACSVSEVLSELSSLANILGFENIPSVQNLGDYNSGRHDVDEMISRVVKSVPLISVGNTWGSGVIVNRDAGLVLTCSHVVRNYDRMPVKVHYDRNNAYPASMLFRTPEGCQFDLAVLTIKGEHSESQLKPEEEEIIEGAPVYIIGHALFPKEHKLQPTITSGIISKIVKMKDIPVMLQTTCAVHAGVSGGAVVSTRGRLVAIVVCNAKDSELGSCYPHINMCVPVSVFSPVIRQFTMTKDTNILKDLYVTNSTLQNLWTLGNKSSSGMEVPGSKL